MQVQRLLFVAAWPAELDQHRRTALKCAGDSERRLQGGPLTAFWLCLKINFDQPSERGQALTAAPNRSGTQEHERDPPGSLGLLVWLLNCL